ncbi:carbonic anhydrase 1-like [Antedon mediterranea]|uniref:carbonic anhydrase 1-like n=1 Tax=Antedon mediterranea TaxID=105859 RepID=UPI003AF6527E
MVFFDICIVFALIINAYGEYEKNWGYHGNTGPEHWSRMYPNSDCSGKSQSPIEFSSRSTTYKSFDPLFITNLVPVHHVEMYLNNDGHSLMVKMNGSEEISGAGLGNTYLAEQFHFHWGNNDSVGSEHLIDGRQYPAELHIVHYDVDRFNSIAEAVSQPRGLAVLGFFFEIDGDKTNNAFQYLVDLIKDVPYKGNSIRFPRPFDVKTLFPKSLSQYFRYDGSLTTPDCHESVVWTVFNEPIKISKKQVEAFRNVNTAIHGFRTVRLVDNHRPIQPINNRIVYRSFETSDASYACVNKVYLMLAVLMVCLSNFV